MLVSDLRGPELRCAASDRHALCSFAHPPAASLRRTFPTVPRNLVFILILIFILNFGYFYAMHTRRAHHHHPGLSAFGRFLVSPVPWFWPRSSGTRHSFRFSPCGHPFAVPASCILGRHRTAQDRRAFGSRFGFAPASPYSPVTAGPSR